MSSQTRFQLLMLTLICALPSVHPGNLYAQAVGISETKPTAGKFVEHDDRYLIPYEFFIPALQTKIEMVPIPAGQFQWQVKDKSGQPRQVLVRVEPFWMAKTETTWKQYQPYMELVQTFKKFDRLKIRQIEKTNRMDAVSAPSLVYDEDWRIKEFGGDENHPDSF